MNTRIPVIDIGPFDGGEGDRRQVAQAVERACRDLGFLVVVGHGVPQQLIDSGHAAARAFFDLELETKRRYEPAPGTFLGYRGIGSEGLSYSRDDEAPVDLKESFTIGRIDTSDDPYFTSPQGRMWFQPNVWPAEVAAIRELWPALYRALDGVSVRLMRIFATALGLPLHFFDDKIDKSVSALRALNYPELTKAPLAGQLRAGAHTDYGSLTLVSMQDAPGGLEVHRGGGEWEAVTAPSGAFVVNLGDLMEQWTNDAWRSTLHRVAVPPPDAKGTRRQSLVFFHQPNYDAEIVPIPACCSPDRPPRYARTTSGEHFIMKLTKAGTVTSS
ncbi:2-oxoglutarate and iron-dependent oxygenase domain-containing protein [Sorangium sp. So ce291]|uniref:isopenicillin N synthase family dioxygenase n=1 Tax=Sorangium sp. So ce291 TaxID=3133294 RepID=UPI003F609428